MSSVVVVGGGYAGVMAANRLSRRHDVVLVNRRDVFVERVRLHWWAAGTSRAPVKSLRSVAHRRVSVVVGCVTALAWRHGAWRLHVSDGSTLRAEHVVLALGSDVGAGVRSLEGATAVRGRLVGLGSGCSVRVAGAGLTGVELATELGVRYPQLSVFLSDPAGLLPKLPEVHRDKVARILRRRNVAMKIAEDDHPAADYMIDCMGLCACDPPAGLDVTRDMHGRVMVNPDLSVPGYEGLWAAGDCAAIDGMPWVRMSCAAAIPMGAHVADSINRSERGLVTRPFDFGFSAQCLSVGAREAVLIPVDHHDQPRGWSISGRAGGLIKETLCRLAATVPTVRYGRLWSKRGSQ